jgi:hypothetical protein
VPVLQRLLQDDPPARQACQRQPQGRGTLARHLEEKALA